MKYYTTVAQYELQTLAKCYTNICTKQLTHLTHALLLSAEHRLQTSGLHAAPISAATALHIPPAVSEARHPQLHFFSRVTIFLCSLPVSTVTPALRCCHLNV